MTDSGTEGRTDRRTDGRTGVSKERAIAYMLSRAKKSLELKSAILIGDRSTALTDVEHSLPIQLKVLKDFIYQCLTFTELIAN